MKNTTLFRYLILFLLFLGIIYFIYNNYVVIKEGGPCIHNGNSTSLAGNCCSGYLDCGKCKKAP